MLNIKDTIMSQYAHSPVILAIIDGINDAIDPQYFLEDFYDLVYRLSTAKGFALDIWGQKVGVSRTAPITNPDSRKFGFKPAFEPFNTYPFASTGKYSSYQLPDSQYRELIVFKAAANIIYATAININAFLKMLFPNRRSYYLITGHMTATYVFEFTPNAFEKAMIYNLNILPRPCGVGISYREDITSDPFGFYGSELSNFNNGVFAKND